MLETLLDCRNDEQTVVVWGIDEGQLGPAKALNNEEDLWAKFSALAPTMR